MSEETQNQWATLPWPEIHERIEAGCEAVLLPIGATEQHGPHLGVGMDFVLADKLAGELGRHTQVPVLPTLHYSCSIGHSHRWPGTIALSPTTMIAVLCDMVDWLYKSGVRRVFFLNCHVGNKSAIGCALDTLRCRYDDLMLASFNVGELSPEVQVAFNEDAADWHANAAETSLMLHLAPEIVREDKLSEADDPDRTESCVFTHPVNRTSANGVTGLPSRATAEAGAALYQKLVDALSEKIRSGLSETPPLEASYFNRI